jgi:D-aminopeptidase
MKKPGLLILISFWLSISVCFAQDHSERARDFGLEFGHMAPGKLNSITDVEGVLVGHYTLKQGHRYNTGITAILPHAGNIFKEKVRAAVAIGNGFGKLMGSTQVNELGELETPILLTGTLNVPKVGDGLISYMLSLEEMEHVYSINAVVGETNDGFLSDIRSRPLTEEHVRLAIEAAEPGEIPMGPVGAGAGTICFGFKGGIGSASRRLPDSLGGWTVGVLVQSNFGGDLRINGMQLSDQLGNGIERREKASAEQGSCMIVIATDAPLNYRNLKRLAERSFFGIARTGGYASNGSGDYAIAFSNCTVREEESGVSNGEMSPLFRAVAEATEEAIIDSLFLGEDVKGYRGSVKALPVQRVLQLLKEPVLQ